MQKQQQAGLDCDRLGANPTDIRRRAEGATFDVLRGQADHVIEACSKAIQQSPSELRYQYQLGRANQFRDKRKAFDIFVTLVKAEYPAAYDNLGGMYLGKDNDKALQLFLRGRDLDDADSMVSLADMIDKGTYLPDYNPLATKLALLKRASDLGHAGAQRAFPLELAKAQQAQANQDTQRQMMIIFGQIVSGAIRH
jgi:TPR repeat protein